MQPIQLGQICIERVTELSYWKFEANKLFPAITEETWLQACSLFNKKFIDIQKRDLVISCHCFVIKTGKQTILVDSCNGNHKHRPTIKTRANLNTNFLINLDSVGVTPQDIDLVICTHLHPDHCGWNTTLKVGTWTPTFPKAKYVMSKLEYESLRSYCASCKEQNIENDLTEMYYDSIMPIVESRQDQMLEFDDSLELVERIWLQKTPGHTLDHFSVFIKENGTTVFITGDVIHHPIQLLDLSLANASDRDPVLATATRKNLIYLSANTNTIILSGHFAGSTAGRIVEQNNNYEFRWLNE